VKLELQVGDRVRAVEIRRRPQGFEVAVDGRLRTVNAAHVGPASWSLLVSDADGGPSRSVEAVVVPQNGAGFDVHIDGLIIPVQLKGGLGRRSRDANGPRVPAGGGSGSAQGKALRVTAPMPGKVLRVLVKAGDTVSARQGLVVVEAMKMENELRAARDGRVREVLVTEGQSVEAGTPLVIVE
jgi:multidrug efflux pump subunit AcrA (membrane-fusion protein)